MLNAETLFSGAPGTCENCGIKLKLDVLKSNAGWYVGTECNCGPYSRESGYFKTKEEAIKTLDEFNRGDISKARI
jgi:hypothetical protein